MDLDKFNAELRAILDNLNQDGYSLNAISKVTFGANRVDQLTKFIKGRDLSGNPIRRMFEDFGFKINIIPIHKNNIEDQEKIDKLTYDMLDALQMSMVNYLETLNENKQMKKNIINYVDKITQKINNGEKLFE